MIPSLGPKWTMILMSIPALGGWICLIIGKPLDDAIDPISLFYIGRILVGFGGGAFALATPLFVSEIAEVRIRGALGALMQFQVCLGVSFVNAMSINKTINWVVITGICIAFPGNVLRKLFMIFICIAFNASPLPRFYLFYISKIFLVMMAVVMIFIPDSPIYLIHKNKEDAARKSLKWLRGSEYSGIEEEISAIKTAEAERNNPGSSVSLGKIFSKAVYLKPLCISIGLMFFQQFAGINFVTFYIQDIFEKSGSSLDDGLSGFIVTFMQVKLILS